MNPKTTKSTQGSGLTDIANAAPAIKRTVSPITLLTEWSEMIKIEHTVFALPFAMSGLVLASHGLPDWQVIFWTVLAFAGARSAAMTLNRLIDAEIDAHNPRTKARSIPAGRISRIQAGAFAAASFALMLLAASRLPPLCLWLSPVAVFWLSFYSFTKRFTWLCHLVLGIALGGAALGGWIAAGGALNIPSPWFLALSVSTWVAGFDIIYALQDVDFDRSQRLFSLPAKFGITKALWLSVVLHVMTVASLAGVGLLLGLGPIFWAGVVLTAGMLFWEHSLVKPDDLSRVDAAFFTVNGIVSIACFVSILLDALSRA
jgi:4-hydroxybenzoate polyprenyltransferase